MTIHINGKAAFFICVAVALLTLNLAISLANNTLALDEVYHLLKHMHFNLVQAPLEAAINDVRSTIDKITPKE